MNKLKETFHNNLILMIKLQQDILNDKILKFKQNKNEIDMLLNKKDKNLCKYYNCKTIATFSIKSHQAQYCYIHKTAEMIDVRHERCKYNGCDLHPSFDIKGGKGKFCKAHKTTEMSNVRYKRCEHNECNLNPVFDIKDGKGKFCKIHKTVEMIDVRHKRCEHNGCDLQPSFDIKGGKGKFCKTHKTAEMINVVSKRCYQDGCDLKPIFDIKGGKGKFCKTHKTDEMIDIKNKRCKHNDCDLRPYFDIKGEKGKFCKIHKTVEMIDVRHKRCEHNGCNLQPIFDIKGGKGKFCKTHKTIEMIDVKNKRCEHDGCNLRPSFGKPGLKVSHCSKHKQKGMIRKSNAKCINCNELAIWGINWIPIHCEIHKSINEQNYVEQPCSSCKLMYILDKDNKCENCNPESFKSARLAKQNALMHYLDANNLKGDTTDIAINNGICGKERPDRVYDFGDKIIILECDENQHQDRQCVCEQTRMVNIGQSFGGIPVYFIRWNPDDYNPKNDNKNPEEISKRYKLVGNLITDIKVNKHKLPNALVSVLYMYYDEWDSLYNESWIILTSFEI